jgi:hypothetical protein
MKERGNFEDDFKVQRMSTKICLDDGLKDHPLAMNDVL